MATVFSALVALVVSGAAVLTSGSMVQLPAPLARFARTLPAPLARFGHGLPALLGILVGFAVLFLAGGALNLISILLLTALIVAALDAGLAGLGAHRLWRVLGQGIVFAAAMAVEWKRGDLFLTNAVVAVLAGIVVMGVVAFATEASISSGASRLPAQVGALATIYLAVIAFGLPNPGLLTLTALVGAAILPCAVLASRSGDQELLLGPLLGSLGWALGMYAWLANASPSMVIAPVVIVGIDVCWTLVRRITTADGRAWLAEAGSWWRIADRWSQSGDDLLTQRVAAASSPLAARGWLLGGTAVCMALGLVEWQWEIRWILAAVVLLLVGVGWVLVQQAIIGLPRADLFSWLTALTVLAMVIAMGARLMDGRSLVTALPIAVAAMVWAAALAWIGLSRRSKGAAADL